MNELSIVALNVKRIIREKCLKQSAIAIKAGYSVQKFNNMLNGRKLITDTDIKTLADVLGVLPNELFGIAEKAG